MKRSEEADSRVRTALDRLASGDVRMTHNARLGLLTNRAARTVGGVWAGDALRAAHYDISLLLSPEHGLDVAAEAGAHVAHARFGDVPILSLYGADRAPVEEALSALDMLVVDLPDVGCRYYTYPWTVRELLRRAAHHRLPVTLLDRPNPLGGRVVEGNLPDEDMDSPVCASPVPVRHGLTMGELALWNRRAYGIEVELTVIPLEGWQRGSLWNETGLPWVGPSPALPSFDSAIVYPGTCLLEGTNVSEGRGTSRPFQCLGAPFVDGEALARRLSDSPFLAGASVEPATFTPATGKWVGEECRGVQVKIHDPTTFHPVAAGVAIVAALRREPSFAFRAFFDRLAGTTRWRHSLESGAGPEEIVNRWPAAEARFTQEREAIFLY